MKGSLLALTFILSLLSPALSISCYSCSTIEVDPSVDTLTNERLREYVVDRLTWDLIKDSLKTECDESAVRECLGDRCIASHVRLESTEGGGDRVNLGTISLHECGNMWLEKDQKFCRSAETGISHPNLSAECLMSTCIADDLCNIPNVLLDPLTTASPAPVEPTQGDVGQEETKSEEEEGEEKGEEGVDEIDQGSQPNNGTEVQNDADTESEDSAEPESEDSGEEEIEGETEVEISNDTIDLDAEEGKLQKDEENEKEDEKEADDSEGDETQDASDEQDSSSGGDETSNESENETTAGSGCNRVFSGIVTIITAVIFAVHVSC